MTSPLPFEQLVFSGGGLRCFWHGGFLSAVSEHFTLTPDRVSGSSGGALSAAAWLAGIEDETCQRFADALARERSNFSLEDIGDGDGRSAHQRVYQSLLDDLITPAVLSNIADGPAFQISVSTPGEKAAAALRTLAAGATYQIEQLVAATPRPRLSSIFGIEHRMIDANAAAREGRLADLIRMAATVPPAFRPDDWHGEALYDGGMVDKAPMPDPDTGRTLVLLTKRFMTLPDDEDGRITFVQPSRDILPGQKLDFTDPSLLKIAWDQGHEDGKSWRNKIS